ncbi:MAG: nitrite reductase, partial [Actinomycetales bacterium]|nr:nitrite reductase [Actinomycetales bacterium]
FDELARASAGGKADYSGLSHARLDRESDLFWPCPAVPAGEADHPGTPRLFLDAFPTPDGRARLIAVDHVGSAEVPDATAPIWLVTGRVLAQYQSGAQTRRVPELTRSAPAPFVEVHPLLAERLGIEEGRPVRLRTRRGEATAPARLTTAVRPDTVFMPFHWAGAGSANLLTSAVTDPISGMPEFKVCAVEVAAVTEKERSDDGAPFVTVPAGAGLAS